MDNKNMPTSNEIVQVIAEHLGLLPEDLDRNSLLREDLSLGPIELNDLLSHLAQHFNIAFEPEEIEGLKKIEDLVVLVEDNLID